MRSTPACDSHDLAEETRRPGFFDAALLGERADEEFRVRFPGQIGRAGGEIGGPGKIQERGQQGFVAHLAGIHELRNRPSR